MLWIRRVCERNIARLESDADHTKRSRNPGGRDAILSTFARDVAAEHRAGGIEQHHDRAGNWLAARAVADGAANDLRREGSGNRRGQSGRDRRTSNDATAEHHTGFMLAAARAGRRVAGGELLVEKFFLGERRALGVTRRLVAEIRRVVRRTNDAPDYRVDPLKQWRASGYCN